ncbi:MAG TPA: DISARM system SNF2-like helicase DrmD [Chloroflexia bacterium]|nr:DISARM system SNF2-like helicase DrmD [Chloroflexia bacterium]
MTVAEITGIPEQGQLVDVRQRRYVVVDVAQNTLPPDIHRQGSFTRLPSTHHVVTLSSIEDDGLGEELQVIWEIEPGAEIIEKPALPLPTGFDTPARLEAFLNAVRWGASSSADVRALQAPFRSGIEIEDYQLDPVVRAIQMPRVNLLIADDVGLGKTIEAGLVAQELIVRHRAQKILIVCPAALQIQWQDQMRAKFGLEFRIIDSALMKSLRRERGLHVNPWTHYPRLITSIDYLKQERMLRLMSEALPAEGESAYPRRFDLLIVDEAHNIAPSGRGKYATDSQRTLAIRRLTPHFEHKLFLSATPHNGYQESFTALLELLDNQRFARGVQPDPVQLHSIMVRRLKSEFKDWAGKALFPKRELVPLEVEYSPEERQTHRWLKEYTHLRLEKAADDAERYATEFTLKLLKKRLLSSPEAFAITLEQHENSLANAKKRSAITARPAAGILRRQLEGFDEESDNDEDLEEAASEALATAAPLFRPPSSEEKALLNSMRQWADNARNQLDRKAARLVNWLNEHIRPGGKWSNERVIIFTEYRATQKWLTNQLAAYGFAAGNRMLSLYGGMTSEEREEIKAAFQADPADSSVRILLATDAASEGIDLQNYCSRLIHYEIPWNPNRMEQRNGRVDRHGQRAPQVNIYHFAGSAYKHFQGDDLPVGELEADLEFLMRAVRKVEAIREDLGKVGPVIATQVEEAMLGQRHRLDTRQAEQQASPIRALLKLEQKIQKEVERLHEQLQESRRSLDLTPENIQTAVEVALELAGQPPLRKETLHDPHGKLPPIEVFYLPPLKGSWAVCTRGLEHPFTGEIRPVVFDYELVKGRDDVVLAHLNHALVAMSLRLLRAQVWGADTQLRLNRVTACIVPDSVLSTPAVIAHARLLVTGGDSQRLHEELLTAGGQIRQGHFAAISQAETVRLLDKVSSQPVSAEVEKTLQELWEKLQVPLYTALETRLEERRAGLFKQLHEREAKEKRDIQTILLELKKNIESEMKPLLGNRQLVMEGFNTSEREQFERNFSALQTRLNQIPAEVEQEHKVISRRFAEPKFRLFPVAVTFLVPAKLVKG